MNTATAHAHAPEHLVDLAELVPLSLVAPEIGVDVDKLAAKLGAEVVLDSIGLRCCSASAAADVIAEHRTTRDAWAETQRREAERFRQAGAARPKVIARPGPTAEQLEQMGLGDSPVAALLAVARDEARKAGPVSPAREFLMSLGVPRRDVVTKETE